MQTLLRILIFPFLALAPSLMSAAPGDLDNDGLRDAVETNTGLYVSPNNTGTNPNLADSDGDSLPDGLEITLGRNPNDATSKIKRPNIIFILADDMGWGDVGCFWQNQRSGIYKFATPGLDSMAAQGAMLTHHYASASICAPTRASFLEGKHQGHSSIRDAQFDAPLPNTLGLPRMLQIAGYKTVHIGKAGLAGRDANNPTAHPNSRGFDRFFGYLTHGQAHEHYPRNGTTANKAFLWDDYQKITNAYVDLFTSDVYTAVAKKTIIEETQTNPDRPFFIYIAYDTPHFIGQFAPTRDYPIGKGVSGGIQWTGAPSYVNTATNNPANVNNAANRPLSVNPAWHANAQRFVGMIDRMDQSISDLLQTLRDLGIDDDTLVVFSADNGPDPTEVVPNDFGSFGPFEGIKGDLLEGGIRVPTIAWWPGKIPSSGQPGQFRKVEQPSAQYDWLATFASLAGVVKPAFSNGNSILPALQGLPSAVPSEFLYFEMSYPFAVPRFPEFSNNGGRVRGQMQAIRIGDNMGVRYDIRNSSDPFMIYNVVSDPKQGTNLAPGLPLLQQRMQRLAIGARRPDPVVPRNYDGARIPAFSPPNPVRTGVKWKSYEGFWSWLPDFRTLSPAASGEGPVITPAVRSRNTDVGLLFEGYLSITTAGSYTFQVASSAESSLWIHESPVIDNDFAYSPIKTSGVVQLSAGLHPLRLFFRHRSGTPTLDLRYSGPGIPMQVIPASSFFTDGISTVLAPATFTTSRNTPLQINALANAISGSPLSLTGTGVPLVGSTSISGNLVNYVPNQDVIGIESFTYQASDGTATASSTVTGAVLFDNEIWFPCDEGSGTVVRRKGGDGIASGNFGASLNPLTAWVSGKSGTALGFRGGDDIVNVSGLTLPSGTQPRSIACWFRTPPGIAAENQAIFSYGSDLPGKRFTIRLVPSPTDPTTQTVQLDTGGGVFTDSRKVNNGAWHHLAVSVADRNSNGHISMDETRIQINGGADSGQVDVDGNIDTGTVIIPAIGGSSHSPDYNFNGDIDEIRIFTRSLDFSEVTLLANATLPPPAAGMPNQDSDGDGATDQEENIAGTDPQDSSSVLALRITSQTTDFTEVTWDGKAGRVYRIQESSGLANWSNVAGIEPIIVQQNTPNMVRLVPTNGNPSRFLRLSVAISNPSSQDSDGDGATNEAEFIAGTDPDDPNSVLILRVISQNAGELSVKWDGKAGRVYRIQESANLENWTDVLGISPVISGLDTPDLTRIITSNWTSSRFLRLSVMLAN